MAHPLPIQFSFTTKQQQQQQRLEGKLLEKVIIVAIVSHFSHCVGVGSREEMNAGFDDDDRGEMGVLLGHPLIMTGDACGRHFSAPQFSFLMTNGWQLKSNCGCRSKGQRVAPLEDQS